MMTIMINGRPHQADKGVCLLQLLEQAQIRTKGIAVAIGGQIIARNRWETFAIDDEVDITVIQATCGG